MTVWRSTLRSSILFLLIIIPPLLHTHLELCDSPDEAAHCHTLGHKLGSSSLTHHLAGLGVKVVWYSETWTWGGRDERRIETAETRTLRLLARYTQRKEC
jgi:hypothetical protein